MPPVVALERYRESPGTLERAIDACAGFDRLDPSSKVLVKPNLVTWGDEEMPIPPFGVFTTTRLVEDLLVLLRERGCKDVAIGEGSVTMHGDSGTPQAFEGLGYTTLARKFGARLVDFNTSEAVKVDIPGGITLQVAKEAIEADFLIDVPVLKTHSQTRVSLGMKNLKGCLRTASKKACHRPDGGLETCIQHLADHLLPSLIIVDGIFALEKGPLHLGNAIRKDTIVASTDLLAADVVAAATIGFKGKDIDHLAMYASRKALSLDIATYEIRGDTLQEHVTPLKWDWSWNEANTGPAAFDRLGIAGIALPKYDETLCSGCSPLSNMVNILAMLAFKGKPLPSIEVLNGKRMLGRPGFEHTILLGSCVIAANKDNENITNAVKVPGCPPKQGEVVAALAGAGLDARERAYVDYVKSLGKKYEGTPGFDPVLFQATTT